MFCPQFGDRECHKSIREHLRKCVKNTDRGRWGGCHSNADCKRGNVNDIRSSLEVSDSIRVMFSANNNDAAKPGPDTGIAVPRLGAITGPQSSAGSDVFRATSSATSIPHSPAGQQQ